MVRINEENMGDDGHMWQNREIQRRLRDDSGGGVACENYKYSEADGDGHLKQGPLMQVPYDFTGVP